MMNRGSWCVLAAALVALLSLGVVGATEGSPPPVAETASGQVRGRRMTSRGGREFSAFTSIPYAKPPTGDRRFKPPQPVDPWEGTLDAFKELPTCFQIPIYDPFSRNQSRGVDDCLYLNVFSPNLTGSMAVMVYNHGGGWRSGGPGPASRSKYFMDEDVVLVTFNYRLGVLGFLSTEDNVISGNFGLKDQLAVLKWVKSNIKGFGGDPDKVFLFGEAAGGASNHLMMMLPNIRDLVSGGISQSGVAHSLWSLSPPGVARYRAHRLAESLGCPTEPHSTLLACLLTKSSKELVESDWKFNIGDYNPTILYTPVIESKDVVEPFLTDSPFNLRNSDKPWITGINSGEGGFKLMSLKAEPQLVDMFFSEMDVILPECVMYTNTSSQVQNITEMLKKKYFSGDVMEGMNDLFLDGFFLWPAVLARKLNEAPMYVYLFDHRGKTSTTDIIAQMGGMEFGDLGVSLSDELLYLFNFEDELPGLLNDEDVEVSKRLIKLWTNFARYGVPTLPDSDLKWKQIGDDNAYLRITTKEDKMETGFRSEAVKFWLSLPIRDKMEQLNL